MWPPDRLPMLQGWADPMHVVAACLDSEAPKKLVYNIGREKWWWVWEQTKGEG